ncbi:hypothetical protein MAIT1_00236 [Magnetofaba australis IT-1]|uniref:Uncharacterized protein n=2 Tax=Magnetofaba TaxID=1472292 RepID=A0A1Y2KAP7_9PROT|nr:hypothetical protein MAIT1_00236 [Magnetofaba australis IT-1]
MVGASIISALHIGLFGVWASVVTNKLSHMAQVISWFGIGFILINALSWWRARQVFDKILRADANERSFDLGVSMGLMIPFLAIFIAWGLTLAYLRNGWYLDELAYQSVSGMQYASECARAVTCEIRGMTP